MNRVAKNDIFATCTLLNTAMRRKHETQVKQK